MNREIKFRGLRTDGKGWVCGDLIHNCMDINLRYCIGIKEGKNQAVEVIPESVGQFTGLKDKNGVDIYEGDILQHCRVLSSNGVMEWQENDARWSLFHPIEHFEIIGNIHQP